MTVRVESTATYQGFLCREAEATMSLGADPDFASVVVARSDLDRLKLQQDASSPLFLATERTAKPGTPSTTPRDAPPEAGPLPSAVVDGALRIRGDLVLRTVGTNPSTVVLRDMYIRPDGIEEVEGPTEGPVGLVRLRLYDVRGLWRGYGELWGRCNVKRSNGAYEVGSVKNDGSPYTLRDVLQRVLNALPGAVRIVSMPERLAATIPDNLVWQGLQPIEVLLDLLRQHDAEIALDHAHAHAAIIDLWEKPADVLRPVGALPAPGQATAQAARLESPLVPTVTLNPGTFRGEARASFTFRPRAVRVKGGAIYREAHVDGLVPVGIDRTTRQIVPLHEALLSHGVDVFRAARWVMLPEEDQEAAFDGLFAAAADEIREWAFRWFQVPPSHWHTLPMERLRVVSLRKQLVATTTEEDRVDPSTIDVAPAVVEEPVVVADVPSVILVPTASLETAGAEVASIMERLRAAGTAYDRACEAAWGRIFGNGPNPFTRRALLHRDFGLPGHRTVDLGDGVASTFAAAWNAQVEVLRVGLWAPEAAKRVLTDSSLDDNTSLGGEGFIDDLRVGEPQAAIEKARVQAETRQAEWVKAKAALDKDARETIGTLTAELAAIRERQAAAARARAVAQRAASQRDPTVARILQRMASEGFPEGLPSGTDETPLLAQLRDEFRQVWLERVRRTPRSVLHDPVKFAEVQRDVDAAYARALDKAVNAYQTVPQPFVPFRDGALVVDPRGRDAFAEAGTKKIEALSAAAGYTLKPRLITLRAQEIANAEIDHERGLVKLPAPVGSLVVDEIDDARHAVLAYPPVVSLTYAYRERDLTYDDGKGLQSRLFAPLFIATSSGVKLVNQVGPSHLAGVDATALHPRLVADETLRLFVSVDGTSNFDDLIDKARKLAEQHLASPEHVLGIHGEAPGTYPIGLSPSVRSVSWRVGPSGGFTSWDQNVMGLASRARVAAWLSNAIAGPGGRSGLRVSSTTIPRSWSGSWRD